MWLLYPGKGNRAKRKADRQETRSGCLKQPAAKPHQEARVLRHVRIHNGCLFAYCSAVAEVKKDFEKTMAECREVTAEYMAPGAGRQLKQLILRLFAPLM